MLRFLTSPFNLQQLAMLGRLREPSMSPKGAENLDDNRTPDLRMTVFADVLIAPAAFLQKHEHPLGASKTLAEVESRGRVERSL